MKQTFLNSTIGQIAARYPKATEVFRSHGIDFCCGGGRRLSEALDEAKLNIEEVLEGLEELVKKQDGTEENYFDMSPAVLTTYIEDTHHDYLRQVLPEAGELLYTLVRVHGMKHRELYDIYKVYGQLKTDLEQHLMKEEQLLFPILGENKNIEEIGRLSKEIKEEHEAAGELLRKLRVLTDGYQVPQGGCSTYKKTFGLLEAIEKDLHQHIHLENNVLLVEIE
jgi:regulator of cell morphogenesis and NO signaling